MECEWLHIHDAIESEMADSVSVDMEAISSPPEVTN